MRRRKRNTRLFGVRMSALGTVLIAFLSWYGGRTVAAVTTGEAYVEVKKVAITFDDGPNPEYTLRLLDGLRERNVTATFFLVGSEVKENPDIVEQMSRDGHLIANHTYEHIDLLAADEDEVKWQVEQTNDLIYEITGTRPVYIRPPYGNWSDALEKITGMLPILWTVDPRDWDCTDAVEVTRRVLEAVSDGSVILFHDSSSSSVEAALAVVDILTAQGYEFVGANEILYE